VQWQYPATTNGSPVTSYVITPKTAGTAPAAKTVGRYVSSVTFDGLATGSSYTFTIWATNARGKGLVAVSNAVTIK
jgi:hypothetical protein